MPVALWDDGFDLYVAIDGVSLPPRSVIAYAVWSYDRFNLSLRNVEDLLAEHDVTVSYETIRIWVDRFGLQIAA